MKRVVHYPCSVCKKLRNGVVLIDGYVSEVMHLIRIRLECGHEFSHLWDTKGPEYKRYIRSS